MAKKTRKRSGRSRKNTSARSKSRGGKKFAKRRSSPARSKKRTGRTHRKSGHQTIRLVIESTPQESSLSGSGRPTRKAMF